MQTSASGDFLPINFERMQPFVHVWYGQPILKELAGESRFWTIAGSGNLKTNLPEREGKLRFFMFL
ncbi:hypothetical protein AV654_22380 [Paenibacillus elgii]|uniref:Uncharacterized protein n=1 Tax=Paenibacillus elgii TaxID=189691 RepID=A0A163X554_9BACL|nr:hypothetical protein AV654_22380 [Paenibacillus elgii]